MSITAKTNLEELEMQQRVAARVITGCLRSTPIKDLAKEANLLLFEPRRQEGGFNALNNCFYDLNTLKN